MTRLLLMAAIAFVCAVMIGCSAPPVGGGRGASDQVVSRATALPVAVGDANDNTHHILSNELPPYKLVAGLSGKITSIGESTTTNLVARIAAEFRRMYPDVAIQVTSSPMSVSMPRRKKTSAAGSTR